MKTIKKPSILKTTAILEDLNNITPPCSYQNQTNYDLLFIEYPEDNGPDDDYDWPSHFKADRQRKINETTIYETYSIFSYDNIYNISTDKVDFRVEGYVDSEIRSLYVQNKLVFYKDFKKTMIDYISNPDNVAMWQKWLVDENKNKGFIKGTYMASVLFPYMKKYTSETTLKSYMATLLTVNYLNMVLFPYYNYLPIGSVYSIDGSVLTNNMSKTDKNRLVKTSKFILKNNKKASSVQNINLYKAGDEKNYDMIIRNYKKPSTISKSVIDNMRSTLKTPAQIAKRTKDNTKLINSMTRDIDLNRMRSTLKTPAQIAKRTKDNTKLINSMTRDIDLNRMRSTLKTPAQIAKRISDNNKIIKSISVKPTLPITKKYLKIYQNQN